MPFSTFFVAKLFILVIIHVDPIHIDIQVILPCKKWLCFSYLFNVPKNIYHGFMLYTQCLFFQHLINFSFTARSNKIRFDVAADTTHISRISVFVI